MNEHHSQSTFRTMWRAVLVAGSVTLTGLSACAEMPHDDAPPTSASACPKDAAPAPKCAKTVAAGFARAGDLLLAWAQAGHVYVAHADASGAVRGIPAKVNPEPATIDDNGENRPKVASDGNGRIGVTYTLKNGDAAYAGTIMVSGSDDDGHTFSSPVRISDEAEPVSQRFDSTVVTPDGRMVTAWIDKRAPAQARRENRDYSGATLYFATSKDGGRTYSPNHKAADHACECCRVATALDTDGSPVVVWRAIHDGNLRDHSVAKLTNLAGPPAEVHRVFDDGWAVDVCPHHGPAVSVAAAGVYDVVWYTGAKTRRGVYHARSGDGGRTFSPPVRLPGTLASHAHVLSQGDAVFLAWKDLVGETVAIRSMVSRDGGRTWSDPRVLASTAEGSDYPFLIRDGGDVYLSWLTAAEGYRLVPVGTF